MSFPKPSGIYPVACTDVVTGTGTDSSLFRLYYPTRPFEHDGDHCTLFLDAPEYADGLADFIKFRRASGIIKWFVGSLRIPVLKNGPLIPPDNFKLPVVLFSHGLGANRFLYSHIGSEIASHGFIVGALEHRDRSSSATFYLEEEVPQNEEDIARKYAKKWLQYHRVQIKTPEEFETRNKQVYERAQECSKLMDCMEKLNDGTLTNILSDFDLSPFKDKLDLEKCGVVGHSFGGATTIVSLLKDPRFKVGVALDVWMFPIDKSIYQTKCEKPLLFINSESFQWASNVAGIRKLDADVTGVESERKLVTLLGTVHHTQCDLPFLFKRPWVTRMMKFAGPTDSKVANEINTKLLLSFFGKYLELPCGGEVDTLVDENPTLVRHGSNVDLDEERLLKSKESIKAEL